MIFMADRCSGVHVNYLKLTGVKSNEDIQYILLKGLHLSFSIAPLFDSKEPDSEMNLTILPRNTTQAFFFKFVNK